MKITRFNAESAVAEKGVPGGVILDGNPETTTWNYYTAADNRYFAGIWESTPGKWTVTFSEHELCTILSGKVVVTPDEGDAETFTAGDSFVIPSGFRGTWETVETVRKIYAIYEPAA